MYIYIYIYNNNLVNIYTHTHFCYPLLSAALFSGGFLGKKTQISSSSSSSSSCSSISSMALLVHTASSSSPKKTWRSFGSFNVSKQTQTERDGGVFPTKNRFCFSQNGWWFILGKPLFFNGWFFLGGKPHLFSGNIQRGPENGTGPLDKSFQFEGMNVGWIQPSFLRGYFLAFEDSRLASDGAVGTSESKKITLFNGDFSWYGFFVSKKQSWES